MTEVDKVFQIAASRIQGLTRQVNHWKDRANELEAALGTEKAARISAEATRDRALNAGAANAELQEELQKERAEHQETRLMFNKGQAKLREQNAKILTINDVVDGIRVQLGLEEECDVNRALENFMGHCAANEKLFIGENQSALGCEMANREEILRAEVAELREELDRIRRGLNCSKEEWEREEERSNKRQVVEDSLGIKSGDNIIEAIDRLKSSDWFDERNHLKYQVIPELEKQRDGLLTKVQDMRAEMDRLSTQLEWERAEIKRLQWENKTMHKDAEDGYAEAIKVLGDPIALSKERDVLRAEVADLKTQLERLTSWAAKNQAARETLQTEIERLKSQMAEQEVSVVGVINERNEAWERCDALRAEVAALQERLRASIARGDFAQMELAALKSQTPKHPVKVGEYVKRLTGFNTTLAGEIGKVTRVDDDAAEIEYEVKRPNGETGVWCAKNCEPCDPPNHDTEAGKAAAEAAVKTEPVADEIKVGDLVEVFQATDANWTRADEIGIKGTVQRINMSGHMLPVVYLSNDGAYALRDVRKIRRGPKPGDKVRLVRKPTEQDYPMGWHDSWGEVGDTSMVYVLSSGRRAVRVSSGFEWPLSCIEFVDAK